MRRSLKTNESRRNRKCAVLVDDVRWFTEQGECVRARNALRAARKACLVGGIPRRLQEHLRDVQSRAARSCSDNTLGGARRRKRRR